ncbi:MAG: hypothetical protein HKM05_01610 [Spirochaetales bacterium]|nr:hypothetical protein [Spirochaetales bacterium]
MMEEILCPHCQVVKTMTLIRQTEIFEEGGKSITYEIEFFRCPDCHEEWEEEAQLDRNLKAAREAYDRL